MADESVEARIVRLETQLEHYKWLVLSVVPSLVLLLIGAWLVIDWRMNAVVNDEVSNALKSDIVQKARDSAEVMNAQTSAFRAEAEQNVGRIRNALAQLEPTVLQRLGKLGARLDITEEGIISIAFGSDQVKPSQIRLMPDGTIWLYERRAGADRPVRKLEESW